VRNEAKGKCNSLEEAVSDMNLILILMNPPRVTFVQLKMERISGCKHEEQIPNLLNFLMNYIPKRNFPKFFVQGELIFIKSVKNIIFEEFKILTAYNRESHINSLRLKRRLTSSIIIIRICKSLRSPGIDFLESIPGLHKRLQIRAQGPAVSELADQTCYIGKVFAQSSLYKSRGGLEYESLPLV
jgi:hypothetical protein